MVRMIRWHPADVIAAATVLAALGAIESHAGPMPPCTEPAVNCQDPDQAGHGVSNATGATSDANPASDFAVRDNFASDSGAVSAAPAFTPLLCKMFMTS